MTILQAVILAVAAAAVALFTGFVCGITYRKKVAEAEIGSAEEKARSIISDAEKAGESKKKEMLVEAKEEIIRNRNEADKELKERRNEVSRLEKRAMQREEAIEHKYEAFEKKEEALAQKMHRAEEKQAELDELIGQEVVKLEQISGLTAEQAKSELLETVNDELEHETAARIAEAERQFKEDSEQLAHEIIATAIQRYAADQVSEATVSVVPLPSDDM